MPQVSFPVILKRDGSSHRGYSCWKDLSRRHEPRIEGVRCISLLSTSI